MEGASFEMHIGIDGGGKEHTVTQSRLPLQGCMEHAAGLDEGKGHFTPCSGQPNSLSGCPSGCYVEATEEVRPTLPFMRSHGFSTSASMPHPSGRPPAFNRGCVHKTEYSVHKCLDNSTFWLCVCMQADTLNYLKLWVPSPRAHAAPVDSP